MTVGPCCMHGMLLQTWAFRLGVSEAGMVGFSRVSRHSLLCSELTCVHCGYSPRSFSSREDATRRSSAACSPSFPANQLGRSAEAYTQSQGRQSSLYSRAACCRHRCHPAIQQQECGDCLLGGPAFRRLSCAVSTRAEEPSSSPALNAELRQTSASR